MLALAYPVFNLQFLAFFSFVPLFYVIRKTGPGQAFLLSYVAGLVFFSLTVYWIMYVSVPGFMLLVLYMALYLGVFGVFARFLLKRPSISSILLIPFVWVGLEILRSSFQMGFGWALLGYSQHLFIPFIQIADTFGVWGVSFLVMLVNCAAYLLFNRKILIPVLAICLFTFNLAYGYYKINSPFKGDPLKISVLQGNVPQYQKWDGAFKESILTRYEVLTLEAAKDKPDLIVWPETSVPGYIDEEAQLLFRITALAERIGIPLLVGAVADDYKDPSYDYNVYYNSALLISPGGNIIDQYNKLHLVPFGEYIPFEEHISFLRDWVNKPIGDFQKGKEYSVFNLPGKFSVLICFEDVFPGLVRRFVKNGARFLINMTNDAWFGDSSAPYQHAQASVFRAIENRVPVVRCGNTGLSCFIDSKGRITDSIDVLTSGYKTGQIVIE